MCYSPDQADTGSDGDRNLRDLLAEQSYDTLAAALFAIIAGQRVPREVAQAWQLQAAAQSYHLAQGKGDVGGAIQALKLHEKLAENLPTAEELALDAELLE